MSPSLMRRAGQALALNAMANWFGMLGGMFSLVFIARLVSPDHFGIYGMAFISTVIPLMIMTALGEALIQKRELRDGHMNSVLAQNLVIAFVAWAFIMICAPWLASIFNAPTLQPVLRVFSFIVFIEALTTVPASILQRDLRYGALSAVDVIGVIVASAVGIACAWIFRNEWALVFMELARRSIRMLAFFYLTRWRPSLDEAWSHAGELAKFNSLNTFSKFVQTVKTMLPGAIIGGGLGAAELGMYNMADRLLTQTRAALVTPFSSVALPVVSKIQDDFGALRRAVEGGIQLVSLLAYPAYLGASVIAPVAIPFVFGAQWEPAVPVIQVVLLFGLRSPTAVFNSSVLLGVGRPDRILKTSIANLLMDVIVVFGLLQFGLIVLAWGLFASHMITWMIATWYVRRTIDFSMRRQLLAGWTSLVSSVVMAICVSYVSSQLPTKMPPALQLITLIGLGIVVYGTTLMLVAPKLARILGSVLSVVMDGRPKEAIAIVRQGLTPT